MNSAMILATLQAAGINSNNAGGGWLNVTVRVPGDDKKTDDKTFRKIDDAPHAGVLGALMLNGGAGTWDSSKNNPKDNHSVIPAGMNGLAAHGFSSPEQAADFATGFDGLSAGVATDKAAHALGVQIRAAL